MLKGASSLYISYGLLMWRMGVLIGGDYGCIFESSRYLCVVVCALVFFDVIGCCLFVWSSIFVRIGRIVVVCCLSSCSGVGRR